MGVGCVFVYYILQMGEMLIKGVGEPFEYSPKMKINVCVCGSICG